MCARWHSHQICSGLFLALIGSTPLWLTITIICCYCSSISYCLGWTDACRRRNPTHSKHTNAAPFLLLHLSTFPSSICLCFQFLFCSFALLADDSPSFSRASWCQGRRASYQYFNHHFFFDQPSRPAPALPIADSPPCPRTLAHSRGWAVLLGRICTVGIDLLLASYSDHTTAYPVSAESRRGSHSEQWRRGSAAGAAETDNWAVPPA